MKFRYIGKRVDFWGYGKDAFTEYVYEAGRVKTLYRSANYFRWTMLMRAFKW